MKRDIEAGDDIQKLVDNFYARAAKDPLLESIFLRIENSAHKQALYAYWESVLLNRNDPEPREFPTHIELMFSPRHFIRWLSLFLETIQSLYSGTNAEKAKVIVIRKSEEFQASLEMFRF